ncbi:hypothetical protein OG898_15300 [Streptomyces sp. NBC_00193]|uniref:hypothetical protein n=1 Tax=unclassified Streptomyces TaxID=2593676 RepID=UPI002254D282|nr:MULTISPECIES: hypothetical protein [unclassified Streptomyces]MCX5124657.1 hypothetical protein [Streptomyces sp. NBC_00347]MCX5297835.1 hypothetical protein [Streptomyces sp. NBC_00193]
MWVDDQFEIETLALKVPRSSSSPSPDRTDGDILFRRRRANISEVSQSGGSTMQNDQFEIETLDTEGTAIVVQSKSW